MLRPFFTLIPLLATILFSHPAAAETYGPDFARFTIKPEPGWTAKAVTSGVQLTNDKSVLIFQVVKSSGMSPEEFAKRLINDAQIENASYSTEDEVCTIDGRKSGVKIRILLSQLDSKDEIAICSFSGDDEEAMQRMVTSIDDAQ
ncbi:MAG: hypothetical protein K5657_08110 [Desulfovibrio sp.]|nr:hypothetical protein [Desulfovibrio sp.]